MTESIYPPFSGAIARKRKEFAPGPPEAFTAFTEREFTLSALDSADL